MDEAAKPTLKVESIDSELRRLMDQALNNGMTRSAAPYKPVLAQTRLHLKEDPKRISSIFEQIVSFLKYAQSHQANGAAHHFAYDFLMDHAHLAQRQDGGMADYAARKAAQFKPGQPRPADRLAVKAVVEIPPTIPAAVADNCPTPTRRLWLKAGAAAGLARLQSER